MFGCIDDDDDDDEDEVVVVDDCLNESNRCSNFIVDSITPTTPDAIKYLSIQQKTKTKLTKTTNFCHFLKIYYEITIASKSGRLAANAEANDNSTNNNTKIINKN